MRTPRLPAALLTAIATSATIVALGIGFAEQPANAAVRHWTISTSAVGPIRLGESLAELRNAGFTFYPCGGDHHPCYFRGWLGAAVEFDVNNHNRVKEIMVNSAASHDTTFATASGIRRGTTVGVLRNRLHPAFLGNYGYGPAYQVKTSPTRRITFFAEGTANTSTIYSIVVSTMARPIQGR